MGHFMENGVACCFEVAEMLARLTPSVGGILLRVEIVLRFSGLEEVRTDQHLARRVPVLRDRVGNGKTSMLSGQCQ